MALPSCKMMVDLSVISWNLRHSSSIFAHTVGRKKNTKINVYTRSKLPHSLPIYLYIYSENVPFGCTHSLNDTADKLDYIVSANLLALTWLHFRFVVRLLACHAVHRNFPILWLRESKFRNKKRKNYYKWLLLITNQDTNRIKFSFRTNNLCLWLVVIVVLYLYPRHLWLFSLMALCHYAQINFFISCVRFKSEFL